MSTRAKFQCIEVAKRVGWGGHPILYSAKFNVVTNGSEENKEFFAATPGGVIEMSTIREDHFEVGQEYYLDFIKA